MNVKPLLDFIAKPESGGDYNIVWAGIKPQDRPKRPLVTMTIADVLAWQESIDAKYRSEAAGRYQIMEDTLRPLPPSAGLLPSAMFDEKNQDALATVLLKRRGLDRFISGAISAEDFANNLAKEWASLPVVTGPKKGRSFYAGDGLNKSHVSVADFLAAVNAVKTTPVTSHNSHVIPVPAIPRPRSIAAAIIAIIVGLIGFKISKGD